MIKHYIILIVSITILTYMFYRIIKKDKLSTYTNDYIIKGCESNIVTVVSLVFIIICLCNLIINIMIIFKELNYLADQKIFLKLTDLLVQRKITLLLEILSIDIRENIFKIHSLVNARKYLYTSFYSIWFIFVGIYFYYKNSRLLYIVNDGIYKFGQLYRWDSNKLHAWDRIFGRDILKVNVIDENGRLEVISLRIYNDDKKTLEALFDTENFAGKGLDFHEKRFLI